ncbi:MAG: tetratricopeptide repeat protein [Burkholderiales bacterium]|nr:tetratricopeptide repeat protein [Burkholderiales bacterium]
MPRPVAALVAALALAGCAAVPPAAESDPLFADQLFAAPSEPVDASRVFTASEAMRRYIAEEIGDLPGSKGRQQALMDALRNKAKLKLEYDAAYTRNAAEAFEARTGNCLSLVIMTASLAREMGIAVRFQSVFVEETWSRQGDLYFSIGHVNLALGGRPPKLGTRIDDGEQLIVDFLPPPDLKGLNWRVVDDRTILAMYMNNRAAESIADGRLDDAYWFAREAIRQDPAFVVAQNTLGVIYQRRGHLAQAAQVLERALDSEPRNTRILTNLANVYEAQGRRALAQALQERLARLEPDPPFAFFNRGLAAAREGDWRRARELFAREVERAPYYHEFHFWLAVALANLGEPEGARRHLALAMENSTTRRDHDLYAAKLQRIGSARLH